MNNRPGIPHDNGRETFQQDADNDQKPFQNGQDGDHLEPSIKLEIGVVKITKYDKSEYDAIIRKSEIGIVKENKFAKSEHDAIIGKPEIGVVKEK